MKTDQFYLKIRVLLVHFGIVEFTLNRILEMWGAVIDTIGSIA